MTKKERTRIAGLVRNKLRWIGVDLYGICLYQSKPKIIKTRYRKKKDSDYFVHFDVKDGEDFVELEGFDYKKVDDELKHNPKLYRIKLETSFVGVANG